MKKLLLLLIVCLYSVCLLAKGNKEHFNKANTYYQNGDYIKAAAEYNSILKAGYESAEAYYNLGNCYYKMNELPEAILNYERAKKLAPEDEDVDFNLKLANLKIIDKIEPIPQLFFKSWWSDLANSFPSHTWALLTLGGLVLAFTNGVFFILANSISGKKLLFTLGSSFLIISFFWFALGNTRNAIEKEHTTAILVKPDVYVKSSPNEKSTDLFILHEGSKVTLVNEIGKWKRIRLANGNEGWIPTDTMEII